VDDLPVPRATWRNDAEDVARAAVNAVPEHKIERRNGRSSVAAIST
jgi:hypothetical protein